jgi:hypothetical protein
MQASTATGAVVVISVCRASTRADCLSPLYVRYVQPVDTYLVCGEKGKALDLRDVYDVAVNPEVIYAVNADLTGQLLTKVSSSSCA